MDRINGADWVDIGAGRRGFRDENLPNGILGTEVTALFLNAVQEELTAIIEASGQALNPGDWSQLGKAIDQRAVARGGWCTAISATIVAPPGAPSVGDVYAIPAAATGAWAAYPGWIAEFKTGGWQYVQTKNGHAVGLPDGSIYIRTAGAYVQLLDRYVRRPSDNVILYVRPDGNDSNTGDANTAGAALATIGEARLRLSKYFLNGETAIIQLGLPGTYEAPGEMSLAGGVVHLKGDPANPAGYIVTRGRQRGVAADQRLLGECHRRGRAAAQQQCRRP